MSSIVKGLLFIALGILSLLWFAYEALAFISTAGTPKEDNPVISVTLTALKLVMAISFFVGGIRAIGRKG